MTTLDLDDLGSVTGGLSAAQRADLANALSNLHRNPSPAWEAKRSLLGGIPCQTEMIFKHFDRL
jgi:hypothetical protein